MKDDSDEDDRCNCIDCVTTQPNLSFRIKEVKKEPNENEPELLGIRRELYVSNQAADEALPDKILSESHILTTAPVSSTLKEVASYKQKSIFIPETIECVKIAPEIQYVEEKIQLRCTNCIEKMDSIDILNQGAFKVTCSDGCKLILHRNCFEKALGSGKKKELKSCFCPTNNCSGSVVIEHRVPGKESEYTLWLRCDVRESEKPRKEEKGKEAKKKEKEKDKHKKVDRREEDENRKVGMGDNLPSTQSNPVSNNGIEPIISLAVNMKREEEWKKNLVRPLPADLEAHPIERKEDALMSKYAVKETNTKENRKKNKKEVRQVILPGLTVKGQRGKKQEDDQWDVNDATPIEDEEESDGIGIRVDNNRTHEESPYGFMMPEEVQNEVPFRERDWIGGGLRGGTTPNIEMNNFHNPFHHPLPMGQGGIFSPSHINEGTPVHCSSQPLDDNDGRSALRFTESPAMDEPPLIENPFDYPTLERESVRRRKDLINFFETHIPILEENAALFDSPQIDLDQLMCMLENFIEFQFIGNDEEKLEMREELAKIFGGEVENDIFPFLMDLQCFKYGYVDGRLVVSVKTEGRERREREDEERRRKDEEAKMKREKEENERRREEKKKEEVRRAVLELEERQRRLDEDRRMNIERREEEERKARDRRRKEEEERRKIEMEERRMEEIRLREESEEANRRELKKRQELEDQRMREMEEEKRKRMENEYDEKVMLENQKKKIEEKRKKEEEERMKRIEEMMAEEEERRKVEEMNRMKGNVTKTKEKELERKTREAINTLRNDNQSKNCSSDSSPERKQSIKCTPSVLRPLHSSAFSTSAPPFVPRSTKAELNPNAPAFFPTRSTEEVPPLLDEKGAHVDSKWLVENEEILEEKEKTIDELNRRVAELEDTKERMEECKRMRDMEISKEKGEKLIEDKKNNDKIRLLENEVREKKKEMLWMDQTISEMRVDSSKKLEERRQMENNFRSEREIMKSEVGEANAAAIRERREKEIVMDMKERDDEEKRRKTLEKKTDCAMESIISCTQIINSLAADSQAQVMTSIFIDLREKWIDHHSMLNTSLNTLNMGVGIDWEMVFSLDIPSMPQETDELVKECYAWHYQNIHNLSYRLAFYVKKCLLDNHRNYEDALIIGIIQKWMRTHKDLSKIDAKVPQVANMVAIAYEGIPLVAPKYGYVRAPIVAPSPVPTLHTDGVMSGWRKDSSSKNEPKGWKKASEKKRDVQLEGHECSICLEDTVGGDISYCEQVSCNEPYHNDCLDKFWDSGFRSCPRCNTPMPPRDAYPALG